MIWKRFLSKTGQAYYQTNISDKVILQIWLDNNGWNWVLIGWPYYQKDTPGLLVLKHGICKTMRQALGCIEELIPTPDEQMSWMQL